MALLYCLQSHVPIWDGFITFWYISLIYFFDLNFPAYFRFKLQVHGIMENGEGKYDSHDI
jgi:hypothetical protein